MYKKWCNNLTLYLARPPRPIGNKVETLYKTKNAGKGPKKFVMKTIAFNKFQKPNFFGKIDWSMIPGKPRWLIHYKCFKIHLYFKHSVGSKSLFWKHFYWDNPLGVPGFIDESLLTIKKVSGVVEGNGFDEKYLWILEDSATGPPSLQWKYQSYKDNGWSWHVERGASTPRWRQVPARNVSVTKATGLPTFLFPSDLLTI